MSTLKCQLKPAAVICVVMMFCLMLTGCWDIQEIKDQSFIIGVGVDKVGDEIEVSLLEVLTSASPLGEEEKTVSGFANTRVISTKGPTMNYCIEVLRSEMNKRVNASKIRFVVFSEELLKAGIIEHMDYLLRHYEIDKVTYVIATRPSAKELLTKEKGTLFPFLNVEKYSPLLHTIKLWELIPQLYTIQEGAVLPLIRMDKDRIKIIGASLLQLDKQQFVVDKDKVRWINILHEKNIRRMRIMFKDKLAFEIRKVRFKLHVEQGKVVVKLKMNGWIIQSKIPNTLQKSKQLEGQLSEFMNNEIEEVLNESKNQGVDLLSIGEKFRQKEWDTSDWDNKLKELNFEVESEIKILSGFGKSE
ncbi:MAG: Ger(x)C family spore germination C-terminal domain-containing protein [Paenibacillaceae bacterium]